MLRTGFGNAGIPVVVESSDRLFAHVYPERGHCLDHSSGNSQIGVLAHSSTLRSTRDQVKLFAICHCGKHEVVLIFVSLQTVIRRMGVLFALFLAVAVSKAAGPVGIGHE